MISSSFRKIETKNLNSERGVLIFLVLRTTLPLVAQLRTGYLNIRSGHEVEAAILGHLWVPPSSVRKNSPWEKSPTEKCPRENCPPEKYPLEISPPRKLPLGKMSPRKMPLPQENCFTRFLLLLTLCYTSSLSNFL